MISQTKGIKAVPRGGDGFITASLLHDTWCPHPPDVIHKNLSPESSHLATRALHSRKSRLRWGDLIDLGGIMYRFPLFSRVLVLSLVTGLVGCEVDVNDPPRKGLGAACDEEQECEARLKCCHGVCTEIAACEAGNGQKALGESCSVSTECLTHLRCCSGVCNVNSACGSPYEDADIIRENHAPVFEPINAQIGTVGQEMRFTLHATDEDGDKLTYFISEGAPEGASLDRETGEFKWTPQKTGDYNVVFGVIDGQASASVRILISVQQVQKENHKPTLDPLYAAYELTAGQQFELELTGHDEDGDELTYGFDAQNAEDALALQDARMEGNRFIWTPGVSLAQKTVHLTFKVQDTHNSFAYSAPIALNIAAAQGAVPVLDPILENGSATYTLCVGKTWAFNLHATDADGDRLTYGVTGAPSGATLNSGTGAFSYTATEADIERYLLSFEARDPSDNRAIRQLTLIVTQCQSGGNHAPVLSPIEDQQVQIGAPLSVGLARYASDQDNDALSFSLSGQPAGATLDANTGVFSYAVSDCDLVGRSFTFNVIVSDGEQTTSGEMTVRVIDPSGSCGPRNHAPTLREIPSLTAIVGQAYTIDLSPYASDQDGDLLTYHLSNAPTNASINSSGRFAISPTCSQANQTYTPTLTVTDPHEASASKTFTLNIQDSTPACRSANCDYTGDDGDLFDTRECNHDEAHAVPVMDAIGTHPLKLLPGYNDWFKFTAVEGQAYSVAITFDHSDDAVLNLTISDDTRRPGTCLDNLTQGIYENGCITENDISDVAYMVFTAPQSREYYIEVFNFNDDAEFTHDYQLYFAERNDACPDDRLEYGDVRSNNFGGAMATKIDYGITPWLSLCGDQDWFFLESPRYDSKFSIVVDQNADAALYAYKNFTDQRDYNDYYDIIRPSETPDLSGVPNCSSASESNPACVCTVDPYGDICEGLETPRSDRNKVITLDLPASSKSYYIQVLSNTTNVFYDIVYTSAE